MVAPLHSSLATTATPSINKQTTTTKQIGSRTYHVPGVVLGTEVIVMDGEEEVGQVSLGEKKHRWGTEEEGMSSRVPHGWPVGQGRGDAGLTLVNGESGKLYSREAEAWRVEETRGLGALV